MAASLNPYISQCSEAFDAEKSSQYRMAIQFSLGGLSFALLDCQTNALVGLEFYQSDWLVDSDDLFHTLERALASKDLNNKTFRSVSCLFDNRFCTLVPKPWFNEVDQAKYLEFTSQIPEGFAIGSEKLEKAGCHNVFAFPKALQDKVLAKWKDTQIRHTSTLFINKVMENQPATRAFVNVRNRDFDMAIRKDGKLLFFNNFRFNTKEDFAYFLLFAMEQNGLSGQDTSVCFSGLIRPASEIIALCGRYVKDIHFVEAPESLNTNQTFKEVPFQYYFIHYQALR
ncbi:MAG: DUF3822 family protein [Bacteroidales bacterium]|nr:DUF3822 family protein [Bacteroidales bacterium]